jgi:hypothetical protein
MQKSRVTSLVGKMLRVGAVPIRALHPRCVDSPVRGTRWDVVACKGKPGGLRMPHGTGGTWSQCRDAVRVTGVWVTGVWLCAWLGWDRQQGDLRLEERFVSAGTAGGSAGRVASGSSYLHTGQGTQTRQQRAGRDLFSCWYSGQGFSARKPQRRGSREAAGVHVGEI